MHTAKTKCRKFETNIPRKEYLGLPISTFMCLWANYIVPWWVCLFCWRKYVNRSWEYINRSQTHECGNCCWGRAIPRTGIYKRNRRCSANQKMTFEFFNIKFHHAFTFWTCVNIFYPWKDIVGKKVSKLRSIAELMAFYGTTVKKLAPLCVYRSFFLATSRYHPPYIIFELRSKWKSLTKAINMVRYGPKGQKVR